MQKIHLAARRFSPDGCLRLLLLPDCQLFPGFFDFLFPDRQQTFQLFSSFDLLLFLPEGLLQTADFSAGGPRLLLQDRSGFLNRFF